MAASKMNNMNIAPANNWLMNIELLFISDKNMAHSVDCEHDFISLIVGCLSRWFMA